VTPRIHRGLDGSGEYVRRFLGEVPVERTLLVCRPASFEQSGAREWLTDILGTRPPVFAAFSSNPKIEEVEQGVRRFRATGAKAIIAVGGGSILDMAKLVNYFGSRELSLDEYLANPTARSGPLRPLLAIPTTAGSGSEATRFAVVYRGLAKYSVSDPAIRPGHVLLVPEFTASASPYQTACSGMDALAQGIESHWAVEATAASRGYAREAIRLALTHLPAAVDHPTLRDRSAMLEAAHLAGKAIDISKTTGAHAFSYILTSTFGLPHGHAVGLLLPAFVRLHHQAGIELNGIDDHRLRDLMRAIGLDRKLPVTTDELETLFNQHVNLERLANNPVPVSAEFIRTIAAGLAEKGFPPHPAQPDADP